MWNGVANRSGWCAVRRRCWNCSAIRYRGPKYKLALTLFVIAFIGLGILGILPATELYTWIARVLTVVYFAFFLLMPWYTKHDRHKQEPERVSEK